MPLTRVDLTIFDNVPRLVPGAQIYVCTQPASTGSIPPSPLATVYSDPAGSFPITQPVVADGNGRAFFYAASNLYTYVITGGTISPPQVYPDQNVFSAVTGGITLETNGSVNANQSLLNIAQGSNITVANSGGTTTISGTAVPITFRINGTNSSSQSVQNLINGTGITVTDGGSGNITISSTGAILLEHNGVSNGSQSILNLKNGVHTTVADDGVGGITIDSAYPIFQVDGVALTSSSTVNFVDSATIQFSNPSAGQVTANVIGSGGQVQVATFSLTTAQIKTLRATPVQLLATPGSSEQYKLVNVNFEFVPVTTPYATVGKNDLSVYVDTTKATIFQADSQGLIDQTVKTYEDAYALVPVAVTPTIVPTTARIASFDATVQAAAISGQSLIASLPYSGRYRVSWYAVVTQAATTNSTLGGANGFQVVYTDVDTNASATSPAQGAPAAGSNLAYSQTNQGNAVGNSAGGTVEINAKTGTALTFNFGYTSVGATVLQYAIHVRVEALDQTASATATVSYSKFFTTDARSTNQAIMLANVSGAEYTAGDGTLTVNVYYEIVNTV